MRIRRRDPKKNYDKRDYDYWRKRGYGTKDALTYARAERWGYDNDLEVVTTYEEERYEDVYGEKPPKGVDFVTIWIVPAREYSTSEPSFRDALDSIGFVPDRKEDVREAGAEMLAGLMQRESMPVWKRR
jgi:hypothetical protein